MALLVLWAVLIGAGFVFLGPRVFHLMGLVKEPLLVAFTTASSEAAYPKLMEKLHRFGVNDRVTLLWLPLGYSFNLDGSMVYQSFAALFIAQAYGIEMLVRPAVDAAACDDGQQQRGAGVPRASRAVVAAVLPTFGLPEAGLLLIMGIDQFLDMGRTATNVIGNSIATSVVAKWEGQLGEPVPEDPGQGARRTQPDPIDDGRNAHASDDQHGSGKIGPCVGVHQRGHIRRSAAGRRRRRPDR